MELSLRDKRALVCGSTQGIGKAAAIELALLGASVTLLARNVEALNLAISDLDKSQGQRHGYLVADFSDPRGVESATKNFFRDSPVHILVNNTGGPPGGQVVDAHATDFLKAFSAHVLCNQILVQGAIPFMKSEHYGRVVNIISTSVKIPIAGLGVSNTIRGAVASWSKTLSLELAPFGITVNNVLPGSTQTGRIDSIIKSKAEKTGKSIAEVRAAMIAEIPGGRIGEAKEIAAMVAFLSSPAASYVNGVSIPVDGGRTGSI